MKEKYFYKIIENVRLDVRWKVSKGKVTFFCINLSKIDNTGNLIDIYRVDTSHDYPHEQKFWRSPKPIKLEGNYNKLFNEKKKEVIKNWRKYLRWFEK